MENLKIIKKENLLENLNRLNNKKICAMVKCNAYGHGYAEIVKLLDGKVEFFGVANIKEAAEVRKLTQNKILLCGKVNNYRICKKLNLDVVVEDEQEILQCLKYGIDNIHLKIDCGMNRFGCKSEIELKMINKLLEENKIELKSIMTHFPKTKSVRETKKCYKNFMILRSYITQNAPISFGGSGVKKFAFDYDILRVGLALYGYGLKGFKPVLKIESFVEKIVTCKKGEILGYGHKLKKGGIFAILPIGYGDGLRQKGKIKVEINGKTYKSEGKLCMDAMFVRVARGVEVGDKVCVMSNAQKFEKNVSEYEILTSLSKLRGKTIII